MSRGFWLTDNYNLTAPIINTSRYVRRNRSQIRKQLRNVSPIIALGIVIIVSVFGAQSVIAYYNDVSKIEQEKRYIQEMRAYNREKEIQRELQEQAQKERAYRDKLKNAEYADYDRKVRELKSQFQVGDRVHITWWSHGGIESLNGDSNAGQIRSIKGLKVYGTWGTTVLDFSESYVMKKISAQELRDIRKKEKDVNERNLKKKESKSWGTLPGIGGEEPKNKTKKVIGTVVMYE